MKPQSNLRMTSALFIMKVQLEVIRVCYLGQTFTFLKCIKVEYFLIKNHLIKSATEICFDFWTNNGVSSSHQNQEEGFRPKKLTSLCHYSQLSETTYIPLQPANKQKLVKT